MPFTPIIRQIATRVGGEARRHTKSRGVEEWVMRVSDCSRVHMLWSLNELERRHVHADQNLGSAQQLRRSRVSHANADQ